MKYLMIFAVMLFSFTSSYAQKGGSNTDYYAMGVSAGCQDGSRSHASAQRAYNSIINNSAIRDNYKAGYREGWARCREATARGAATGGSISDFAKCYVYNDKAACKKINKKVGEE